MERSGYYRADDGTSIWYGSSGSGPAIVTCDGLACDGFIWPYMVDCLVYDFEVVRWHYRAHGRSDVPSDLNTLTVEQIATDLVGVIDAAGLEDVILMGHSMGVQVILEAYQQNPAPIRGLIPICGSYKKPLDTFHNSDALRHALPYMRMLVNHAPETVQSVWEHAVPSSLSRLVATLVETNPELMEAEDVHPYLEHVAQMDVEVFVTLLENVADHDAGPILPTIEVPTLVVAGEDDTFTPMFRSEEMAEAIPDSNLTIVPGGTHAAPLEAPDLINSTVSDFLKTIGRRN